MEASPVFVGVDVSKARLDVASTGSDAAWSVANASEGIVQLVQQLREVEPALVVMEATGGFEVPVAAAHQRQDFAPKAGALPDYATPIDTRHGHDVFGLISRQHPMIDQLVTERQPA